MCVLSLRRGTSNLHNSCRKKRGESHLTMDHGAVVAASMMAVHHMTTTVSDAVAPGYSFF